MLPYRRPGSDASTQFRVDQIPMVTCREWQASKRGSSYSDEPTEQIRVAANWRRHGSLLAGGLVMCKAQFVKSFTSSRLISPPLQHIFEKVSNRERINEQ